MRRRLRGSLQRRFVTLLTALTFAVVAVSGVLAFVRAFSLEIIGLHALMGFVFIALIAFHVANNIRPLKRYLRSKTLWLCLAMTAAATFVMWQQPGPIKALLGLSGNLGPALERFEMNDDAMVFQYSPADHYKMALTLKTGKAYDVEHPPQIAIWLENQGAYHIKTLLGPDSATAESLPYWTFKVRGWEKAKRDAELKEVDGVEVDGVEIDGVTMPTPNGSFDPADYILPADPENPMPYKLLIEINQPGDAHAAYDDQPSLVYAVEIDNAWPQTFQLLEIVGYPKREDIDDKEAWSLYYVDEGFGSALKLIDSALLTIERGGP